MTPEQLNNIGLVVLDKLFVGILILLVGFLVSRTIEKLKSRESLNNEITKIRVQRIARFFDLISEYEHWLNRLISQSQSETNRDPPYLTSKELKEADEKQSELSYKIGLELNQMRFWLNNDIYIHAVKQLEFLKLLRQELILEKNFDRINELRFLGDSTRMNVEILIEYIKRAQKPKIFKENRDFLYKKTPNIG